MRHMLAPLLILQTARCAFFPVGFSDVIELDCDAYKNQIESVPDETSPDWIFLYYSSMCGHCRLFSSDFSALASQYKQVTHLRFGAIDLYKPCNRAIIRERDIRQVPLLHRIEVVQTFPGEFTRLATALAARKDNLLTELALLYGNGSLLAGNDRADKHRIGGNVSLRDDPLSYQLDAATAMSHTLNYEIFRGNSSILQPLDVYDLALILDACSSNIGLDSVRSDCASLLNNLVPDQPLSRSSWESLLSQTFSFAPLDTVPRLWSCETPTCALWRLLHIFSIETEHTTITPISAMMAIRALVDKFMSCEDCRAHFLTHFDACDFGRCDSENPTWQQTTMWLYRFHNAVTLRVHPHRVQWLTDSRTYNEDDDSLYVTLVKRFTLAGAILRVNEAARLITKWWWIILVLF